MECICGYKHIPKTELLINGSVVYETEPFIKLELGVKMTGLLIVCYKDGHTVNLYACPKCGTLKVEV